MSQLQPNKHAKFDTRYDTNTLNGVNILLRQHIGLGPMPSYRSIARLIESAYPVKISGTTVKRMLDKIAHFKDSKTYPCIAPIVPESLNQLTANENNAKESPKSGVAAAYAATDTKYCNTPILNAVC